MEQVKNKVLIGERAMFASLNKEFINCTFEDGESPLKESKNIKVNECSFKWKYPLWYCNDVEVFDTTWDVTARSGVWYTNNLVIRDSKINAPKQFRRCNGIKLNNVEIPNALETMWMCQNIEIKNTHIVGDYFGMNSKNIVLENVIIDGNYCFDGGENIKAFNCVFNSKDSFWNCNNVELHNCKIVGEYLAWNTKHITFINCQLESLQGLCYIDDLKLVDCKIYNTNLAFEFCSNINATILTKVDSIKNPISGYIRVKGFDELILDKKFIDPEKTIIEVK